MALSQHFLGGTESTANNSQGSQIPLLGSNQVPSEYEIDVIFQPKHLVRVYMKKWGD
jgi:hypothetical protein